MNCTNAECETSVDDEKGLLITFRERYEAEEVVPRFVLDPAFFPLEVLMIVFTKIEGAAYGTFNGDMAHLCKQTGAE